MSAFVVPDRHINALVSYASALGVRYSFGDQLFSVAGQEQEAAQLLYAANVRSVAYRYAHIPEEADQDPNEPFKFVREKMVLANYPPLVILKACDCYDYQACEVDDYYESQASALVNAIRKFTISKLPGYSDAKGWCLS
jgi:hypothetical protein